MKRERRKPDSPDHSDFPCPYCGSTEKDLEENTDYEPDRTAIKNPRRLYKYMCLACGKQYEIVRLWG